MKSVGEVMAIGRTFQESLQKALRGLEIGTDGFNPMMKSVETEDDWAKLRHELRMAGSRRLWYVGDAFRHGLTLEEVGELTAIDPWFLAQIKELIDIEKQVDRHGPRGVDAGGAAQAQAARLQRPPHRRPDRRQRKDRQNSALQRKHQACLQESR